MQEYNNIINVIIDFIQRYYVIHYLGTTYTNNKYFISIYNVLNIHKKYIIKVQNVIVSIYIT